jgi:cyclopropane fatty-acyl-phospholipid synthase-like methyltransferase
MVRRYPSARIVAVSNSDSQRLSILRNAEREDRCNLTVEVAEMNIFAPLRRFDRVVSVEMFEHMSNWPSLLQRVADWTKPNGVILIHVFNHRRAPYRFDYAAVIPDVPFIPGLHVNYGETKLSIRDGLLKLKDFPHGFGGSGIEVAE